MTSNRTSTPDDEGFVFLVSSGEYSGSVGAPITCSNCGRRVLVSKETSWAGTSLSGKQFTICRDCFEHYPAVFNEEADALKAQGGEA